MSSGLEIKIASRIFLIIIVIALLTAGLLVALAYGVAHATQAGVQIASDGSLGISLKIVFLSYAALLAASVAHALARRYASIKFAITNTLLLLVLVLLGYLWLREYVTVKWAVWCGLFVIAIQTGVFGFAALRRKTLRRLLDADLPVIKVVRFDQQFTDHSYAYVAIPAGAFVGSAVGIYTQMPPPEILRVIGVSVTLAILGFVAMFLLTGVRRLLQPLIKAADVRAPGVNIEVNDTFVRMPSGKEASDDQLTLDSAVMATDIRRLQLFNQYQLLAVVFTVALLLVNLTGSIGWAGAIIGFVLASLVIAQVPYGAGQRRAHEVVLGELRGVRREEVRERLNKLAPIFPKRDSFTALTMSGTVGGFMFKAVEKIVTDLLVAAAK